MGNRDYLFDNVKAILIILVIFGHLIEFSASTNEMSETIYKAIYLFHMPAFILVSGYFAKKSIEKVDVKKMLWRIALPFFLFQVIYITLHNKLFEFQYEYSLFTPYWIMWFMVSLILWHLMLYLFKQIKYPIFWSIVLALVAGFHAEFGLSLSLSRTIVFFPFFLIGASLTKKHIQFVYGTNAKIIGLVLGAIFVYGVSVLGQIPISFLWSSGPYVATEGITEWQGVYYRAMQYVLGLTMTVVLLTWVPKKKIFLSTSGMYTIYIYLTHGIMVKLIQYQFPEFLTDANTTTYFHFLAISIVFSLLISSKWSRKALQPLVEPATLIKGR